MSTAQSQQVVVEATAKPQLAPFKFFEAMSAYQQTSALKAAIDLDLFSAIAESSGTAAEVAERIGAPERGVRALCDFLVVRAFLNKTLDRSGSRYSLTPDSAMFLDKKSPAYLGTATRFLASETVTKAFRNLAEVVRSGGPLPCDVRSDKEDEMWVEFARSMAPVMFIVAQQAAKLFAPDSEIKVLDIAAGHGMFGIQVAQHNAKAKIVALDWPSVLAIAKENAERFQVAGRYSLLPGNALEVPVGNNYDGVIVANFLHHMDRAAIRAFLKKMHAAMAPKGRIVVVEFAPNEDRVSPPIPASFVLNMFANTPGGDAYSFSEYQEMLRAAGFSSCEVCSLPPTPQLAIVGVKE
ncbi:MAG TPA: class I SAM-dependent methyltransferase [Candidatus Saccharimonadales bacterium]|nr:class I SAM-dependent methyltransferase [Candidatus Saccharimonadales bacterium]